MTAEPALAELQREFQRDVLADSRGLARWVRGDARADAAMRLAVYARAYRLRLLEALGKDYPTLAAHLGAEEFQRLGLAYLDAYPSNTPSVRWFGRHLPAFLRCASQGALRPELVELAQWDWALGECFDAAEAPCLTLDEVAALPAAAWPELRLRFVPALRRLDLHANVPALYRAASAQQPLPALVWQPRTQSWQIWRDAALDVRWRSLAPAEASALDAARSGASFAQWCAALAQCVGEDAAPQTAASLFKRWLADGLIAAARAGDAPALT